MRASSGEHFVALDHIRAVAAFMVFTWHFNHGFLGFPVAFEYVPGVFLLAPLDEGHTGVALFMTLSGYLFAKLLEGKSINYAAFLWNRFLRLAPLLCVVLVLVGVREVASGADLSSYLALVAKGVALPTLPNGGWSITAEAHFYIILPVFLWLARQRRELLLAMLACALVLRTALYFNFGEVHRLSFWTIAGRVDQFLLGMLAFYCAPLARGRHIATAGVVLAFSLFYWYFDWLGGFYLNPSYPSPSPLWIMMPTVEGAAYAWILAYYDGSFAPSNRGVSRLLAMIGAYSYSIYLFHFFFVFAAARFIHEEIMDLSNFYVACAWAAATFLLMVPVGYLSFRFIEAPFLRRRKRYAREEPDAAVTHTEVAA